MTPPQQTPTWTDKLIITVGLVLFAHFAQYLKLPWLSLGDWYMPSTFNGWIMTARHPSSLSVVALGTGPMVSGYGLAATVYGLVPALRRKACVPGGEHAILRAGFFTSVVFAIVASIAMAMFLHDMSLDDRFLGPEYNPWPIGIFAAFTGSLIAALPLALSRWGLGTGIACAVLVHTGVPALHGEPRTRELGTGLALATLAYAMLAANVGYLNELHVFHRRLLELLVAVGGGLVLANGRVFSDRSEPVPAAQLLQLGVFVVLAAATSAFLTKDRLAFPWTACVVATLILCTSWQEAQNGSGRVNETPPDI